MSRKKQKILLVANEVPDDAVLDELIDGSGILVVAPALNSRLRHWLSDEDDARRKAEHRLAHSLERLADAGAEASG